MVLLCLLEHPGSCIITNDINRNILLLPNPWESLRRARLDAGQRV